MDPCRSDIKIQIHTKSRCEEAEVKWIRFCLTNLDQKDIRFMLIHTHFPPARKTRKHPLSARKGFWIICEKFQQVWNAISNFSKAKSQKLIRQTLNTYICVRICTQTKILPSGNLSTDKCTKETLSLFRKTSIHSSSTLDVSTETKAKTKTNLKKKHRTVVGQRARGLAYVWLDIRTLSWIWVHKCCLY